MLQELKFQLSTAILTVLTGAAAIAAGVNYDQIHKFKLPDDGAVWVNRSGNVIAAQVLANESADRAGIRAGDILESIQAERVRNTDDVPQRLAYIGAWQKAAYVVRRAGVDVPVAVIIGEAARGIAI